MVLGKLNHVWDGIHLQRFHWCIVLLSPRALADLWECLQLCQVDTETFFKTFSVHVDKALSSGRCCSLSRQLPEPAFVFLYSMSSSLRGVLFVAALKNRLSYCFSFQLIQTRNWAFMFLCLYALFYPMLIFCRYCIMTGLRRQLMDSKCHNMTDPVTQNHFWALSLLHYTLSFGMSCWCLFV